MENDTSPDTVILSYPSIVPDVEVLPTVINPFFLLIDASYSEITELAVAYGASIILEGEYTRGMNPSKSIALF